MTFNRNISKNLQSNFFGHNLRRASKDPVLGLTQNPTAGF